MSTELLAGMAIIFIGALIQGVSGFGFAIFSAPLLVFFLPHTMIPPVVVLLSMINNLLVLLDTRAAVNWRLVLTLLAGAVIGLPLGSWVLSWIDAQPFKLALGVLVLAMAIALLAGWRLKLRKGPAGLLPVGGLSGFLSSATSLSGPPVILYFASQDADKQFFRGNLIAYFMLLNIGTVISFLFFGQLNRKVFTYAAWCLPVLLAGSFVGIWIARRINEKAFGRLVLGLLVLLGIGIVAANAGALF